MGGIGRLARCRAIQLTTVLAVLWLGLVAIPPADAADPVLVGAGDIAGCRSSADAATAALAAATPGTVITLGDNAYESGTAKQFADCYGPTWGRVKGRTRPSAGNHDYFTPGATPYYDYFGAAAGPRGKGWYSYDVGAWHVVVLNSNCGRVACVNGSEQEQWLRSDLAAHPAQCTLAYWHAARFVSDDNHGDNPQVAPFWNALYQYGADLVLSAHAHVYERFAPQTPTGQLDPAHGLREIVVGTGGENRYGFGAPDPNSVVRNASTFGVINLALHAGSYDWRFVPTNVGGFTDSGSGTCHGAPPTPTTTSRPAGPPKRRP
jgi:acid phosphatase type 7